MTAGPLVGWAAGEQVFFLDLAEGHAGEHAPLSVPVPEPVSALIPGRSPGRPWTAVLATELWSIDPQTGAVGALAAPEWPFWAGASLLVHHDGRGWCALRLRDGRPVLLPGAARAATWVQPATVGMALVWEEAGVLSRLQADGRVRRVELSAQKSRSSDYVKYKKSEKYEPDGGSENEELADYVKCAVGDYKDGAHKDGGAGLSDYVRFRKSRYIGPDGQVIANDGEQIWRWADDLVLLELGGPALAAVFSADGLTCWVQTPTGTFQVGPEGQLGPRWPADHVPVGDGPFFLAGDQLVNGAGDVLLRGFSGVPLARDGARLVGPGGAIWAPGQPVPLRTGLCGPCVQVGERYAEATPDALRLDGAPPLPLALVPPDHPVRLVVVADGLEITSRDGEVLLCAPDASRVLSRRKIRPPRPPHLPMSIPTDTGVWVAWPDGCLLVS